MAVPNTNTFSLNDVRVELGLGTTASLIDCISNASASGYGPAYYTAPATSLLEFRNYSEPIVAGNTLKVTPTTIDTDASASSNNISVTSNTTWAVTEGLSWVSISGAANTGNDTFTLSILINNTGSPRSGDVTVSTTSGSPSRVRVIAVSQGSGFE